MHDKNIFKTTVASDVSNVVFQPADWSIVNIPLDLNKARKLADNLYNCPSNRHITLVLNRHRRKDRIKGLSCISAFDNKNWKFMESVNIAYGKPSTCSNNGFLPLAEQGYLFYKGDAPDAKATKWMSSGEYQNATNDWNLFPSNIENMYFKHTYYQKFSWELQLVMKSLAGRLEHSRFIYAGSPDSSTIPEIQSLYSFCIRHKVAVEFISTEDNSKNITEALEKLNHEMLEEVRKV